MEVSETLKKAWAAVEGADLPETIHEVAFREAVRLLVPAPMGVVPIAAKPGLVKPAGDAGGASRGDSGNDIGVTVSEEEIYQRVVAQTGVDRDKLEQVVHLDGEVLKVSLPGIKLGKNNAERARAVAQILTISRSFGFDEAETSLDLIRAECDRLRVYDQNNFSSHMKALNGFVVTGTGTNRRVRAKSAGIAAFPALLDTLVGAE
jgi:hypothetical protein